LSKETSSLEYLLLDLHLPLKLRATLAKIVLKKENVEKGILLEKTKIIILNKLKEYLELGGFPEIVLKEERFKLQILKQYFDDILYL